MTFYSFDTNSSLNGRRALYRLASLEFQWLERGECGHRRKGTAYRTTPHGRSYTVRPAKYPV